MDRGILIVDDDPSMLRLLERFLSMDGYEVLKARNGAEALCILHDKGPQIVITDWEMPEMDGLELCRTIRSSELVGFIYTVILTAHADKIVEAFEAGADDFLSKPPRRGELLARLKAATRIIRLEADLARQNREIHKVNAELSVLNSKLERMATTDELTGLANRREALNRLNESWATSTRHDQPLSCIVLDIDHFKQFNDTYGHDVGDLVLRETARALARSSRTGETVCRFGGEEFLVVCPNATVGAVTEAAERLRAAVEANKIKRRDQQLTITVSLGVAGRDDDVATPDDLLKAADEALYAAKRSGRNRVWVAGSDRDSTSAIPVTAAQDPPT
jgi:two-component system cell cycle response regulator